ncbi:unnamed protein product [Phytophthora lilii]|uniref:Unnamed protein product n=1 Tax=Phytophthora lilii TaxID=2077276 RepID=A0A9W6X3N7_9STRA|nr:unnamed protein product [Phytophthora lilii]
MLSNHGKLRMGSASKCKQAAPSTSHGGHAAPALTLGLSLCVFLLLSTAPPSRGVRDAGMWLSASPPRLVVGLLVVLAVAVTTTSAAKHTSLRAQRDMHSERQLETTLADARSLRVHFKLKRSSMQIYGQSEFDVFANPVVSSANTAVRYDGYANFTESGTNHTFVLVDGIAYFVTSTADGTVTAECSSSSSLAPLNLIIPALNDATAISSAIVDDKKVNCPTGDLFKVVLGDATFVLCASGSAGFVVYGSDLDISVQYLDSPVSITAPTLSEDEARACGTIVTPSPVTATTLALLTAEPLGHARSLTRYLTRYFSYSR